MSLWMIPFILFWSAIGWIRDLLVELAPVVGISIGVVSVILAVVSVVLLIAVPRRLLRSSQAWLRGVGVALAVVAAMAAVAFVLLAVIAFVAVATLA